MKVKLLFFLLLFFLFFFLVLPQTLLDYLDHFLNFPVFTLECLMCIRVYGLKILSRASIITVFGSPPNLYEEQTKRTWDSCFFPRSLLETSFLSLMLYYALCPLVFLFFPFSSFFSLFFYLLISLFSCCYENDLIIIWG